MPLTYLAHQAPLLPILRRWPRHVDGLTLLIGSMSPDFAYALSDTPFELWAHGLPGLATFCVPVTLAVSWLIARVLARVLAAHLPDLGAFHLHDLRAVAAHRFTPLRSAACAFLGAWSHVLLDSPGHAWGWPARHWEFWGAARFDSTFLGRAWSIDRMAQYAGHLLLTPLCVVLLYRYGSARWLVSAASQVEPFQPTVRSHVVLWGATALTVLGALSVIPLSIRDTGATIQRVAGGVFGGLLLGALLARGFGATSGAAPEA